MRALFILFCTTLVLPAQQKPKESYPLHPDSKRQDGVPKGSVTKHVFDQSRIYPGTTRDYWIYVPAQYKKGDEACLMVFQDGARYVDEKGADRIPIVFDNLIHKGDLPVTIGLFIQPGVVPAPHENAEARYNRSFEYDAFNDRYARFLIEEMIPLLAKDYKITKDPNKRAICGASSGAIAAFNAAWQRPDAFRRVYSTIGTFVGLRGGHNFPILIRKTEPKPLRVFLQDGRNDLNIYGGSWWVANQDMLSALEFAGYEVKHEWGEGGHNRKHGGAIMPDVLRWLWENPDKPVTTHPDKWKSRTKRFLVEGEGWKRTAEIRGIISGLATAPNGDLYFVNLINREIFRTSGDGKVERFVEPGDGVMNIAFGPDGRLFGCRPENGEIVAWDLKTKKETIIAEESPATSLVVAANGNVYFAHSNDGPISVVKPGGKPHLASKDFPAVSNLALSPDQTLLYASDFDGRYAWSAQVQADGSLEHAQPFFHFHLPPALHNTKGEGNGLAVAKEGYLFAATAMGVQICDQAGRVQLIVPQPHGAWAPSVLTFGGKDGKTLYLACMDRIYQRRIGLEGSFPWKKPGKPPKPKL